MKQAREHKDLEEIQIPEIKHIKLRIILAVFFLVIAVISITYSLSSCVMVESGWREISVETEEANCGVEFVFRYNLGYNGAAASAEFNEVRELYSDAMVTAYQVFNTDRNFVDVHNLHYISSHPNEVIEVGELLYRSLQTLEDHDCRVQYMAPIYAVYDNIFFSDNDDEAKLYDPVVNEEVAEFFAACIRYTADPEQVRLELLGDNKVKLCVSEEYLEFARQEEIESFLDLYWMKNAFIVDYIADVMLENNHGAGYIASYNGYTRNFDQTGSDFAVALYHCDGDTVYDAATMNYSGAKSIVYLRNYPLGETEKRYYYTTKQGEDRTMFLSPEDGTCISSINELIMQSSKESCAEILMKTIPLYLTGEFDEQAVQELSQTGFYAVYCKDQEIHCLDDEVGFGDLYEKDGISFSVKE
ncbi:MAG: hypothetical protein ACI39H_07695 [Lachnospiraceae bacterium]